MHIIKKTLITSVGCILCMPMISAHAAMEQGGYGQYSQNTGAAMEQGGYGQYSQNTGNQTVGTAVSSDDLETSDSDSSGGLPEDGSLGNIESFEISEPTIFKGHLDLGNVNEFIINAPLYVYGTMEVGNSTLTVNSVLRVTKQLEVGNSTINYNNGIIIAGKFSAGNTDQNGKKYKIPSVLKPVFPILRANISEEELKEVTTLLKNMNSELATLKKELISAKKTKGDTSGIAEKMRENRTDLYAELEGYTQDEDVKIFDKLESGDIAAVNKFIKKTLGK